MRYRRDLGTQVVDAGIEIGGKTGVALQLAGMFLGLTIALLQLTALAWITQWVFGDIVWWIYFAILAFIAYRTILQYQHKPGRHHEEDREGRHSA